MITFVSRLLLIVSVLLLAGCASTPTVTISGEEAYRPRHAERFSIYHTDGESTVIEIRDPWQGADSEREQIFVSRSGERPPEGFEGQVIEAPVRRVVCFSASYVAFLDALGCAESVCGVSGASYISCNTVRERYAAGAVREVGYDTSVNYELIAAMRPDMVLLYGIGSAQSAITGKLAELGIPFMYVGEYVESSPLGRAEWIVPFGELTDRRDRAVAIFDQIATRYDSLRTAASELQERPSVLLNSPYRDVWFVPGDRSYMVQLISDAGGSYLFTGDDSDASRPISGEAAYLASLNADVWLNPSQARSLEELKWIIRLSWTAVES